MKKINANVTKVKNKGSVSLPSKKAVRQLTAGDAFQRSLNNYAKVTPSGSGALGAPSVMQMSAIKFE